jgi:CDP-glucose 4,6-dehydratase
MEDMGLRQRIPDAAFWRGKRVLVTGHSGFKGGWLVVWLRQLGATVVGLSLPPTSTPNLYSLAQIGDLCDSQMVDIRDAKHVCERVRAARPDVVFHLAAQPLVRAGYADPVGTYAANVMGSVHLLDALRGMEHTRVAVMITTDKVYRNNEWPWPYREDDTLGGHDPYSASKAASELVIASYRDAYLKQQGLAVASARAGNVIGGGDWSANRLIPDAVRAWQNGSVLEIRRAAAIRPWQHVLEPLLGYLLLAERLWHQPDLAGAYNFGPVVHEAVTVRDVVEMARAAHAGAAVRYGDGTAGPHEAGVLALETAKARMTLGVHPKWNVAESVRRTMGWYQAQQAGADALALCEAEITAYAALS